MIKPEIEDLIVKFVNNNATVEEKEALNEWVQISGNKKIFKKYVKNHYRITYNSLDDSRLYKMRKQLLLEVGDEKKVKVYPFKSFVKYAAAVLLIGMLTTVYIYRDTIDNSTLTTASNTIQPGTNKAILTLEDGSVVALEKGDSYKTEKAESNGSKIIYKKSINSKRVKTSYNYLTIPRGGEFFVELSDGTKVWLNSETQLKYPTNFVKGKDREVELVYGEAYFDVSPSTEHDGAKFRVINSSQEVEVVGTQFNIKAYKDESHVYTTLVEGKVNVKTEKGQEVLKPNQQAILLVGENKIRVKDVDVKPEISWIKGEFSFKGKALVDIMKIISRWYDVDVVFENKELEQIKFRGVIDKKQSIEEVLLIMKSRAINNYEIKNNTIILK